MITDGLNLSINIMDYGCNIGEHDDGHVNYALTIYLADTWKEEYGGLLGFRKKNDENLKYICPKFNSMILLTNLNHIVTNINVNMKRISIQGFYRTQIYYKNKDINLYLNNIKMESVQILTLTLPEKEKIGIIMNSFIRNINSWAFKHNYLSANGYF